MPGMPAPAAPMGVVPTPPAPAAPAGSTTASTDAAGMTRKKTIEPITDTAQTAAPDLNALLAKEGITSIEEQPTPGAAPTMPHPPGHVISPNPTNAAGQPVDPSSISL